MKGERHQRADEFRFLLGNLFWGLGRSLVRLVGVFARFMRSEILIWCTSLAVIDLLYLDTCARIGYFISVKVIEYLKHVIHPQGSIFGVVCV